MPDTLFTKIINGDIPSHKIYEDDKTYAFLDIYPKQPGHTLVVPKTAVDHLWDLSDEDYVALMQTVKKLGLHLREQLPVQRVGVSVEGFDVPHVHVHLIPCNSSNEMHQKTDMEAETDHSALAAMAQKLAL